MFWGSKPYSGYPHAIYRYQHAHSLVLAIVMIYIHTYIPTCTKWSFCAEAVILSVSDATQRYVLQLILVLLCCLLTAILAAWNDSSTAEVERRSGYVLGVGGIVWRKLTMAADDSRHSTRTLSVCSAERHLCPVVLRNYRHFDIINKYKQSTQLYCSNFTATCFDRKYSSLE